ncbi:MAG: DUF3788 domain-containing protein [Anaerolineae bacterium]|nr:DUF3788 domain-containing protein [Anaerolineae bacterium]
MAIGIFLEKERCPTAEDMSAVLGATRALWERLTHFITQNYDMPGEWSFGGKKYGWNLWYRRSGKTLASLYPQQGFFIVQIVLGKAEVEQASHVRFGNTVQTVFEETPQLHDGRWLFIKVTTEEDIQDIEQLLIVKKRPKRPQGS